MTSDIKYNKIVGSIYASGVQDVSGPRKKGDDVTVAGSPGYSQPVTTGFMGTVLMNLGNIDQLEYSYYRFPTVNPTSDGDTMVFNETSPGSGVWEATFAPGGGGSISGSGTANKVAFWSSSTNLTSSNYFSISAGVSQAWITISNSTESNTIIYHYGMATQTNNNYAQISQTTISDIYNPLTRHTRRRGTFASPTPILEADPIGVYAFNPGSYDTVEIKVLASESHSGTSNLGSSFQINTITNASGLTTSSERFKINGDGSTKITGQIYSDLPLGLFPTGTTQTVNWNRGNGQTISLQDATGNVTLTFTNPKAGAVYVLKITQRSSVTFRNIVWPAEVKWSGGVLPTISAVSNAVDTVVLFYDGTNYYANISQNYS
jgi:hypothetical protein